MKHHFLAASLSKTGKEQKQKQKVPSWRLAFFCLNPEGPWREVSLPLLTLKALVGGLPAFAKEDPGTAWLVLGIKALQTVPRAALL